MRPEETWTLDLDDLTLSRGAATARLTAKAAAVLECLLRHQGAVVSHATLLGEVWPGVHVTPDLVREYVFDLRAVLGDDARAPRMIETVRGRGYRLIGGVCFAAAEPAGRVEPARVAVLDFGDPALDARWRRLAAGLADDIAADLSRYPDIAVIARVAQPPDASERDPREIAHRLSARHLVRGRLDLAGDRLRILVQLVEGGNARIRWSERYDRPVDALPAMVAEIAANVAGSLGGMHGAILRLERDLVRRRPANSLEAYEHYLLASDGLIRYDRDSTFDAAWHAERAVTLDPDFARGWLVRAWLANRLYANGWRHDRASIRALEDVCFPRAYECDSRDSMALAYLALHRAKQGAQTEARRLLERAVDLAEGQCDALMMLSLGLSTVAGRFRAALDCVDRAYEFNPGPPTWYGFMEGRAAFFAGEHARALSATDWAADFLPTHVFRLLSAAELGAAAEVKSAWEALRARFPAFDFEEYAIDLPICHPAALTLYRAAARKAEAIAYGSGQTSPLRGKAMKNAQTQ